MMKNMSGPAEELIGIFSLAISGIIATFAASYMAPRVWNFYQKFGVKEQAKTEMVDVKPVPTMKRDTVMIENGKIVDRLPRERLMDEFGRQK